MKLDVEQDKDLAVSAPKPAEVQIYQYYENGTSAVDLCLMISSSDILMSLRACIK